MDALTIAAASGIRTRLESLDLLANNIANQATAGYKTDREFYNLYASAETVASGSGTGTLPVIESRWTDFSQGTLTPTGSPLDLALSGDGFFVIGGPSGPLYTRNGNFQLSRDGTLETQQGFAVADPSGSPIQLDLNGPVEITKDGIIKQNGIEVGELGVVRFKNPERLNKFAGVYFQAPNTQMRPERATGIEVHQAKLESANFAPAEAAVRLVGVMRQFEMLQKAVQLGSEMNRKAVDEVAKAGS